MPAPRRLRLILSLAAALALPGTVAAQKVITYPPPRAAVPASGPANPDAPPAPRPVSTPGEVRHEAPVNGVLTLYGDQRCPTDTSGNEVVVCVRRGAAEQFRIPKELRDFKVTPQNESWAKNQVVTLAAGQSGIGTCTTVGAGGAMGCVGQQTRAAKAEAKERAKDATPDLSGY